MEVHVGQRAIAELEHRLRSVDLADRSRVEAELRETLAAFPEVDANTIRQLYTMAGAPPPELTAGWSSALELLLYGEAPLSVREAMMSWGVPVQEDWSTWAGTWKTATISPVLAYATNEQAVRMGEEHRSAFEKDMQTMRHRFDLIIAEIDRVQSQDPLGRRRLLEGIEQTIREPAPKLAAAIAAALAAIPSDPGFNSDGAAANRAEELLLDAVRAGLSKASAGPDGPHAEQMQHRLWQLALQDLDAFAIDPGRQRHQALLMWYLLAPYASLTGRTNILAEKGLAPPPQQDAFTDHDAYRRNAEALREIHDVDRAVNGRNYG